MADSVREKNNQNLNETALVIRAQEGNQQAFAILCNDYYTNIHQYLMSIVGYDNAGDVVQETFTKAWLYLPKLREPTCFRSWLHTIARRCAYDHLKHQKPQIPLDMYTMGGDGEALSVPGPEEATEQRELLELALSQITPIYRDCLILYVKKGLSKQEVAKRLNIKETSFGTYLYRAKEEWRQNYQELLSEQTSPLPKKRKRNILPKKRKGKTDE